MASTTLRDMIGDWDPPSEAELREWAVYYARRGWYVWPTRSCLPPAPGRCTCRSGASCKGTGKHGRPGWTGDVTKMPVYDIDTMVRRAQSYWDQDWNGEPPDNVAILPHLSGLVVADVDGQRMWEEQAAGLGFPETLTEVSGRPDGGWHLWYSFTLPYPEYRLRQTIPGTDIEIKHRSLVLTTPSLHKSGHQYQWADINVPVAPAPEWMTTPATERPVVIEGTEVDEDAALMMRLSGELNRWTKALLSIDLAGVERLARMNKGIQGRGGGRPGRAHAMGFHLAPWTLTGVMDRQWLVDTLLDACRRNGAVDEYGAEDLTRQINNGIDAGRKQALALAMAKEGQ